MSTQTDILITYQLTSNSIESLKSVDESEYWKRKLIELLLTRSIHVFSNDENSTQIVYDQISNNRISVLDKKTTLVNEVSFLKALLFQDQYC